MKFWECTFLFKRITYPISKINPLVHANLKIHKCRSPNIIFQFYSLPLETETESHQH